MLKHLVRQIKQNRFSEPEKIINEKLSNLIIVNYKNNDYYINDNHVMCSHHTLHNILYMHYYSIYYELKEYFDEEQCYKFIDEQVENLLNIKSFVPIRYFGNNEMIKTLRILKINKIYIL